MWLLDLEKLINRNENKKIWKKIIIFVIISLNYKHTNTLLAEIGDV